MENGMKQLRAGSNSNLAAANTHSQRPLSNLSQPVRQRKWLIFGVFAGFLSNLQGKKSFSPSLRTFMSHLRLNPTISG
jgi:hypothetical protein